MRTSTTITDVDLGEELPPPPPLPTSLQELSNVNLPEPRGSFFLRRWCRGVPLESGYAPTLLRAERS